MRAFALGLLAAASFSLPGFAAERDGPADLISPTDALRIAVQGLLSNKSGSSGKSQKDALAEYYGVPDRNLLWVDENGLTERAKLVMAEIAKADDYGLRASDYPLPDTAAFSPSDPKANDWLAESEMKVSSAVVDYAKDARGGRLEPLRLSKNLDPKLALPNPSEVLEFDCHPLRPRRLFAELSARPTAIRGAQAKADRTQRRQGRGSGEARRCHHSQRAGAQIRHGT